MAPGSSGPRVGGSKACYTPNNVVLNKVIRVTPRDNNSAWLTKYTLVVATSPPPPPGTCGRDLNGGTRSKARPSKPPLGRNLANISPVNHRGPLELADPRLLQADEEPW